MNLDKYKVHVDFEIAGFTDLDEESNLSLKLNHLFHDMVKLWAKDYGYSVSPTKTTVELEGNI